MLLKKSWSWLAVTTLLVTCGLQDERWGSRGSSCCFCCAIEWVTDHWGWDQTIHFKAGTTKDQICLTPFRSFHHIWSILFKLRVRLSQVVFYKRINKVFFTDVIPKAPSGKILRKDLRAKLAVLFPWCHPFRCHKYIIILNLFFPAFVFLVWTLSNWWSGTKRNYWFIICYTNWVCIILTEHAFVEW